MHSGPDYIIRGLDPAPFSAFFEFDAEHLAAHRAQLVRATGDTGFPCRVSLEEAREGERLLLVHHVSHDVEGPYRMAHAIFVRERAQRSAEHRNAVPAVFDRWTLGLRAFAADGAMRSAMLAPPGEAHGAIRALLDDEKIAYIHAHNAAHGCFLAGVERG